MFLAEKFKDGEVDLIPGHSYSFAIEHFGQATKQPRGRSYAKRPTRPIESRLSNSRHFRFIRDILVSIARPLGVGRTKSHLLAAIRSPGPTHQLIAENCKLILHDISHIICILKIFYMDAHIWTLHSLEHCKTWLPKYTTFIPLSA